MIERKQTPGAAVGAFLILVVAVMAALFLGDSVVRLVLSFEPSANLIPDLLPPLSIARLVLLPIVVLAATAMMILPGALLFAGMARPMDLPATMLAGFGLTSVTVSVVLATLAAAGILPTATLYGASCLVLGAVGLVMALRRGGLRTDGAADVATATGLIYAMVVLLAGKLALESWNGDGFQALIVVDRIVNANIPFWPDGSGFLNSYPDFSTFMSMYPTAWISLLFGSTEFSARMVAVPPVALTYLVILALAAQTWGRAAISNINRAALITILIPLVLSLAYSASYDTFGDMASPMARQLFFVVMMLSAVLFAAHGRLWTSVLFTLLSCASLPTGWGLLGLVALIAGGLWRLLTADLRYLPVAVTCAVFVVVTTALGPIFHALDWPGPGNEFSSDQIAGRLRYLSLTDVEKFGFLAIPVGIVPPILALALIRRGSRLAVALTLTGLVYFLFFYVLGFRSMLHHFVPAGLLLLTAFWLNPVLYGAAQRPVLGAVLVGALASTVLALPASWALEHRPQIVARAVELSPALQDLRPTPTFLDVTEAIDQSVPQDDRVERRLAGRPQFTGTVLSYYAARRPASHGVAALISVCAPSECTLPAVSVHGSVMVQKVDAEALGHLILALPGGDHRARILSFHPEKLDRWAVGKDGVVAQRFDVKAFLSGRLGR